MSEPATTPAPHTEPPPAANARRVTPSPEVASNDIPQPRQRSQAEIDIACWLFDNMMTAQSHAQAIADALVSGRVPHIEAITTQAA